MHLSLLCFYLIYFLAPSGRPSNSSGISLNATHIYLTWDPPPLNQTHGDIQGYCITIVEYESDNTTLYTSNTTDLVAGPLHPYYTYHCSIQAVTVEPGPPIIIIVRTHEAGTSFERCNLIIILLYSLKQHHPVHLLHLKQLQSIQL